jgi:ATP-dependent RNA helicase DeaD
VKIAAVYGGSSIVSQIRQLRNGVHIVIATPGRLIDLIERKAIDLSTVQHVVLDEADEMLNMGFREDINFILDKTRNKKSTWLFSATMPPEVRNIAKQFMHDPQEITVGKKNTVAANISHEYYITHAHDRYEALKRLIDFNPGMYGIIFTRTKADAQEIAEKLIREGYDIDSLHGDLSQPQRDKVMSRFRDKSLQLLIATDVAARGIDVEAITHVINYSLPDDIEVYTHRSGRTARAGRSGVCISLLHAREFGRLRDIERIVKAKFERKEIPTGRQVCEKQFIYFFEKLHNATTEHGEYENYLPSLQEMFADMSKEEILTRMAALELAHMLKYYEDAKDLNIRQPERRERSSFEGADRRERFADNSGMISLFINLGTKDNFYKASFLQLILDMSGLSKDVLGKIVLRETSSFIEIDKGAARQMIESLNGKNVNGRTVRINLANSSKPSQSQNRRPDFRRKERAPRY